MLFLYALLISMAHGLELQGFVTSNCEKKVGMAIYAANGQIELLDIHGRYETIKLNSIQTVYIFNVINNPIPEIQVDQHLHRRLRALYTDDMDTPRTLAWPVRFIDDLIIFYSVDGKSHVHTYADIHKIRPAPPKARRTHKPAFSQPTTFEFAESSDRCPASKGTVKATRVLADQIAISEFYQSLVNGYESLDGFQERTYLYAKPYLFEPETRLGIVFIGERQEPAINFPLYFQWSTGEPYRFQSQSVVGSKVQEFTPHTEPLFALRSDVKSHFFHGMFVGNVAGVPAGQNFLLDGAMEMSGPSQVVATFNYMALMGGDYGPYSLSFGFYYPNFGIKIGEEYREVLGSHPSYAVRVMYTTNRFRLRVIGAGTSYDSDRATKDDVLRRVGEHGSKETVDTFSFSAVFIRGGLDFALTEKIKVGADLTSVTGNYKETVAGQANDIRFLKMNIQPYIQQNFSNYVSLTAYANIFNNTYEWNFNNVGDRKDQRETVFFGTFEFIF